MAEHHSRRSFLSGVLACGTLSAGALYLLPGGRSPAPVTLRLVTGVDPTGARDLLIGMWNQVNPRSPVETIDPIASGSGDERVSMLSHAENGQADILNLDIIDIPEFAGKGLITPIPLRDRLRFVTPALRPSQLPDEPDMCWAVPFNTDVGMLFRRRTGETATRPRTLAEIVDRGVPAGSGQFVSQLGPNASNYDEAFVVNVLEHALARDATILDADGTVSDDLERWQGVLHPLRDAVRSGRVRMTGDEGESLRAFVGDRLRYMRNWPVKYRELQQAGDADVRAGRIDVDPLPIGILGGQSLALVARSPHADQARRFIEFLTDEPAQKILAAHGLAPTRISAYGDANLKAVIPHLTKVRQAVERARLRPITANYRRFAEVIRRHVGGLLHEDQRLSARFVVEMRQALS